MLYREPTDLHLIIYVYGSSLTSNYILKFSVDADFLCFVYQTFYQKLLYNFKISKFFSPTVNSVFLSKDQEIFTSQKK